MKKPMRAMILVVMILALILMPSGRAMGISEDKKDRIISYCDEIKNNLKTLQHTDSRMRVYLGRHYETIISKFVAPLNMRLAENNMPEASLVENQNKYVTIRQNFVIDFIEYQKVLEELVIMDCKNDPERFYDKLELARVKRKLVAEDVTKLDELNKRQLKLVTALEAKL